MSPSNRCDVDTPQDWRREDELDPPEVPAVEVDGRWQPWM